MNQTCLVWFAVCHYLINITNFPSNGLRSRYRKKANSYSITHTHLHGLGSGQVQQAIYALQAAHKY
ncbi:hypothetical protein Sbal195_4552 (plasmid) [Shewanella baltica OS195]|uniref:Uncharacterized protein n=1 Tax=Shewanella baltica (strain OS195) TaxID=399599 RepID=A9L6C7_SHEB9|nr:hypothetical protein Sbal195_4552 [Shewanella baltica OS195]